MNLNAKGGGTVEVLGPNGEPHVMVTNVGRRLGGLGGARGLMGSGGVTVEFSISKVPCRPYHRSLASLTIAIACLPAPTLPSYPLPALLSLYIYI